MQNYYQFIIEKHHLKQQNALCTHNVSGPALFNQFSLSLYQKLNSCTRARVKKPQKTAAWMPY
ncbi:MAG: hypothetical protein A2934_04790 [Candidatus Sungbacteria bacterium RIFCSPLOWO2_01_FULL_47_10]|uniref:Uncharacterized protein n=1 Tax=Candidatus Sungbacteria bacterium RIFCSPLOWO2_01_FULL_47_10 TaxID=1802276 RepID=A0A1G2L4G7_9BACT|nr:MAG: hypothetical protein A2934_04790 [Candidatus Sungbacteria bacterium RIFCSPLOWO2_01_FULL_47_10]